ncbi:hypothetical protein [Fischerella thermalis]|nr:hypothetical protein [Fischerella thermalis]
MNFAKSLSGGNLRTLTRSRLRAYAQRPGGNFKAFQDGFRILD